MIAPSRVWNAALIGFECGAFLVGFLTTRNQLYVALLVPAGLILSFILTSTPL